MNHIQIKKKKKIKLLIINDFCINKEVKIIEIH